MREYSYVFVVSYEYVRTQNCIHPNVAPLMSDKLEHGRGRVVNRLSELSEQSSVGGRRRRRHACKQLSRCRNCQSESATHEMSTEHASTLTRTPTGTPTRTSPERAHPLEPGATRYECTLRLTSEGASGHEPQSARRAPASCSGNSHEQPKSACAG